MISFRHKGDFSKFSRYLEKAKNVAHMSVFDKYGQAGVAALASATPVETGLTADSWSYQVQISSTMVTISFINSNFNKGVPIALILQFGHGTGTGGWVEGRDYINPAIQPVFEKLANDLWEEVTRL